MFGFQHEPQSACGSSVKLFRVFEKRFNNRMLRNGNGPVAGGTPSVQVEAYDKEFQSNETQNFARLVCPDPNPMPTGYIRSNAQSSDKRADRET